ncbi:MAG: sulfatase-like hydrolase/transferase [Vicinamibacterales bacterium]
MSAVFDNASSRRPHALTILFALLLLNVSVTFTNVWPTPAVTWTGALSIELGLMLWVLLVLTRRGRPVRPAFIAMVSAVWALLVFGRYADVTTPALLGRPINLFWDVRYAKDVTAMFVQAAPLWRVMLAVGALLLVVWAIFRLLRWSIRRIALASADRQGHRRLVQLVALALSLLFVGERALDLRPTVLGFATPVTHTYLQQARLIRDAFGAAARQLPPTPPLNSDLSLVAGADVLLVFMESYGAITWQRDDLTARLAGARAEFAAAIAGTGRSVVSAYVESPTYGGSSWFAHISLLSGIEIRDPDANALLMAQRRETLVTAFARRGFRTVALMPGLWQAWPEGAFYGFQAIYGGPQLAYTGPEFGWWALPDQYTLAKFDALEMDRQPHRPTFVFFPTISTHAPFTPTPPFQPDWGRLLTDTPFDAAAVSEAWDRQPDWTNLSPSYGDAVAYDHTVLAGYLRKQVDRDLVLIVLGDHQPPALVSGEGQPWDVPIHIIASRPEILERLRAFGFRDGLRPEARISKMHELLPVLLDAFGDRTPETETLARRGVTAAGGQLPTRTPMVKLRPRAGAN